MMPPPITSMRLGTNAQFQRAGRIDDARIALGRKGSADRLRSGGDDGLIEPDRALLPQAARRASSR